MDTQMDLVVRKSVTVPLNREEAFRLFTVGMATWWALATHSIGESAQLEVEIEGWVGGRILEQSGDRVEPWGTITTWDPPAAFSMTWHPGYDAALGTRLTVRFEDAGVRQTRVELEHSGWEVHGAAAEERVRGYTTGWDTVLGGYVTRAGGR